MESIKQKNKQKNKNFIKEKNETANFDEKKMEKNIFDYFILDEDENNVIINSKLKPIEKSEEKNNEENKDNNNKLRYNLQSFISSNFRPDLYSPLGIIGGSKYNLRKNSMKEKDITVNEEIEEEDKKEEDKEEENEEEKEEEEKKSMNLDENIDNVKKEFDKYKLLKLGRYYILDDDITVKCHNCGEIGHIKDNCPFTNLKFCHRCLSYNHNDKDCKNKKCFRCNKSGHNKNECPFKDNELLICFNCENSGHRKNDCLINPCKVDGNFTKNNGLSCFYCGSSNHLICPLSDRDNIELKIESINFDDIEEEMVSSNSQEISSDTPSEEDYIEEVHESKNKKKKNMQIIEGLKNEDIKFTIFCGFCGERHRNEDCPSKDEQKFSNEFDNFRKNICKKILERRKKESEEEQRINNLLKKRNRENSQNNNKKNQKKKNDIGNIYRNIYNSNDEDNNEFLSLREDEFDLNKVNKNILRQKK